MESANVHQQTKHHPQDLRHHHHPRHQLVGSSSSSSLAGTTCYGVLGSSHPWTPNTILNSESFTSSYPNGGNTINSTPVEQNQNILFPSWNIPMTTQEMVWANANPTGIRGTIKEEFSDNFNPKFQEILTSSQSSSSIEDHFRVNPSAYSKNYNDDLSAKLMLRTISCVNEDFTQNPSNMDMNLQALDLLTASKFNGDFVRNDDQLGLYRQAGLCYGLDHMQQSSQMPNNNKISDLNHGAAEAKRSTNTLEPKAPKKSRVEQRSSCPPFKVRKEKLGDRIAALQQLVAPFGKTDTASVLMEAIGYIKFLQSQVETLSVPYMKSSRNKTTRPMKLGVHESEDEETKRDLRSRGLCLVPLSSLSYMTDGGGGGGGVVWQPPHFGGAT